MVRWVLTVAALVLILANPWRAAGAADPFSEGPQMVVPGSKTLSGEDAQ